MKTILLLGAKSQSNPLDSVPAELSQLKQQFTQSGLPLTVEYEPYLTRDLLGQLLRQHTDQIDILHFAGHSNPEQLETNDEIVYSHHIADLLANWNHKPTLIFLNGCNSAGQVDNFLDAGVTYVIATHQPIDDQEAARFAQEFYANLLANPKQVTLDNAFQRAGSVALLGEPRKARSLDIETLPSAPTEWDWGLFARDADLPGHWTLIPKPDPSSFSSFMTKTKLEQAQKRWQLLFERLTLLQTDYSLETRSDEKMRLAHIIEQNQADLQQVEGEIDVLYTK